MSLLYPRLAPSEAERIFASLHGREPEQLSKLASVSSDRAVFSATGGTRVSRDGLQVLAIELSEIADRHGYPDPAPPNSRTAFDYEVARHLHARAQMVPGEASQRQVWAFLSLVLVPHLCAWRFPMSDGEYPVDRFKGTDLTRHTLARLWTRAHVLRDPNASDPYELIDALGEADIDHVMSRRKSIAATPALVRAIARAHASDHRPTDEVSARRVLRDSLSRLLRLTAFLNLDWMSDGELLVLVREQRDASRQMLLEEKRSERDDLTDSTT